MSAPSAHADPIRGTLDALGFLVGRHVTIGRRLDAAIDAPTRMSRRRAASQLRRQLAIHAVAEEVLVQCGSLQNPPDTANLAVARRAEQSATERAVDRLDSLDLRDPAFVGTLEQLRSLIVAHVERVERYEFTQVHHRLDRAQRHQLSIAVGLAEAAEPPNMPDVGTATEPFADMVDTVRRAVGVAVTPPASAATAL